MMSQASTSSSRHVVPAATAGMWQAQKDAAAVTANCNSKIERTKWTQMWREQLEPVTVTVDSVVDDSSSRSASPTLATPSSPPTSVEHEHEHEDRPPSRLVRTESGWWLRRDSDSNSAPSPVPPKRRDDVNLRSHGWVFGPARQTPLPEDSEDEDDRLQRSSPGRVRVRRSSSLPLPPPRPRHTARPTWSSLLFLPSHVERMVGHRPAAQWASWND